MQRVCAASLRSAAVGSKGPDRLKSPNKRAMRCQRQAAVSWNSQVDLPALGSARASRRLASASAAGRAFIAAAAVYCTLRKEDGRSTFSDTQAACV